MERESKGFCEALRRLKSLRASSKAGGLWLFPACGRWGGREQILAQESQHPREITAISTTSCLLGENLHEVMGNSVTNSSSE